MSSDVQAIPESLLLNNLISLSGVIVVGYDYVLTFSREVDYIWRRKWTWVTVIFFALRYPGLCWAMLNGLIGSTFIPGPVFVNVSTSVYSLLQCRDEGGYSVGKVLFLVSCWTFPVFICAADLVMVLRVYTMWHRSKTILYILLFFFVLQVVVSIVLPAIYNSSDTYFTPSTVHEYDVSICYGTFSPSTPQLLGVYSALPRFFIGAVLLVLAVTRTFRELVVMYNATKRWQPNRYMAQLARDGILYFFINTLYNLVVTITATPSTNTPPVAANVLLTITVSLLCCTMPRFIISVREMYDREFRGRWQGIDTGFGITLRGAASGDKEAESTIAFANAITQDESQTVQGDGTEPNTVELKLVGKGARTAGSNQEADLPPDLEMAVER